MTTVAAVAAGDADLGLEQKDHVLKTSKVYRCAYVGCTKTFNRRDYLEVTTRPLPDQQRTVQTTAS